VSFLYRECKHLSKLIRRDCGKVVSVPSLFQLIESSPSVPVRCFNGVNDENKTELVVNGIPRK
jgi:hypothetical protein